MLRDQLFNKGYTITQIANEIGLPIQDASHYVRGEASKVGRRSWEIIHDWMVINGFEAEDKAIKVCICSRCKNKHIRDTVVTGGDDVTVDLVDELNSKINLADQNSVDLLE